MAYFPAGAPDARIGVYEVNIGDGRAITVPYDIVHNRGSKSILATYQDNFTGDIYLPPKQIPIDNNTLRVWFDVVLTTNQLHAYLIAVVGSSDVTAPTIPTVTAGTPTATTIPITISGSTDAVGVAGYDIDVGGVYVTTIYTNTYTVTGLSPVTGYTVGATPFDLGRNKGPRGTATATTASTPVSAAVASAGTTTNSSGPALPMTDTITGVAVGDKIFVAISTGHVNAIDPNTGYTGFPPTSDKGEVFTRVGVGTQVGTSGTGDVHLFVTTATSAGTHVISCTPNGGGTWPDVGRMITACVPNAGVVGTPVYQGPSASNVAVNRSVSSAAGGRVVAAVSANAALTGLTGQIQVVGASANGNGDYLYFVDLAGATTVTITSTSTGQNVAVIAVPIATV